MTRETVLAETYLGNVNEKDELSERVLQARENGLCFEVTIEQSDRTKGRILAQTKSGQSVGIVKGRDWLLKDGDVLAVDSDCLVLVGIELQGAIALKFDRDSNNSVALVQLGHVLGNSHWPITVQEQTIYIELAADASLIESTILETVQRLGIEGLKITRETRTAKNALDFHTDSTHHH